MVAVTTLGGLAGLGILAGSGAFSRGGVLNGSSSVLGPVKNILTTTAFESARPKDYTTVESALNSNLDKKGHIKNSLLRHLKIGHVIGLLWAGLSALPFGIKKIFNLDDDSSLLTLFKVNLPFGILGGIGSFVTACICRNDLEHSKENLLDQSVQRFSVSKSGQITKVREGVILEGKLDSMDDVILEPASKRKITSAIKGAKHSGQVLILRGSIGTGKTMTAKAIANAILHEDYYKAEGIQVWHAAQNIMERALFADTKLGRMIVPLVGKIGGETITERVERLVANAVKHYRETGEYVVIILDEAHEMFGMKDGQSAVDPAQRDITANELGKLFQDKIRNESGLCKGVVLAMTANSAAKQLATSLQRRCTDVEYKRPSKEVRAELIQSVLKRELEKTDPRNAKLNQDVRFDMLTNQDFEKASEPGTVNLYKDVFHEQRSEVPTYLTSYISQLENRNMVHHDDIVKSVITAIDSYTKGGKDSLFKMIEENIQSRTSEAVDRRHEWEDEILFYSGNHVRSPLASPLISISHRRGTEPLGDLFGGW